MTEEVLISLKGLHTLGGGEDEDDIEIFSAGRYYFKNGKHYILYDELVEETGETLKNVITLKNDIMEVQKKGSVNARMVFERGKKNMSWYDTPFGSLYAGVEVIRMQVTEEENLLEITVDYRLEVNYEHVSDCRIRIRVMAKDSGLFRLR